MLVLSVRKKSLPNVMKHYLQNGASNFNRSINLTSANISLDSIEAIIFIISFIS